MVYHYSAWAGAASVEILHTLGLYGVAAFYVISGISFGYVYRDLPFTGRGITGFWIKRFARLAPLYWLASLAAIALMWPTRVRVLTILANVSLLFGIVRPTAYLATGGWSIGNEIAFYAVFPFVIFAARKRRTYFAAVLAASVLATLWYAFGRLSADRPLAQQWPIYIRPENQVILFIAGIGIALLVGRVKFSSLATAALFGAGVALFTWLPGVHSERGEILLVTRWLRLGYISAAVILCASAALGTVNLPGLLARILEWLGKVSYAVYLLHPIAYLGLARLLPGVSPAWIVVAAIPITAVMAELVYRVVEAPCIARGKRLADHIEGRRFNKRPAVDLHAASQPVEPAG